MAATAVNAPEPGGAADGGAVTWPLLTSLLRAKEFILLGDSLMLADALA